MSKELSDVRWDPVNMEFKLDLDDSTAITGPSDEGVFNAYLLLRPVIESNLTGACDNVYT